MEKELGKFLKQIGIFFPLACMIYILMVILWGNFAPPLRENLFKDSPSFLKTKLGEVNKISDVDVLFLGSSRAHRHYDSRIFRKNGWENFNLGSSAQTFLQTELLVDRYLEQLDPEIVVIDVYPDMFSSDGMESTVDLISSDPLNWEDFLLSLEHGNPKVLNTWIFDSYQEIVHDSFEQQGPLEMEMDTYISGGFVEREVILSEEAFSVINDFEIQENQLEAFEEVIEKILESDREVILVQSPRHKGVDYIDEERLDSLFSHQDLEYFDFHDLDFLNDTLHFYDPMHMNQRGVELYNSFFITEVLDQPSQVTSTLKSL